jgi:hypothetical protein
MSTNRHVRFVESSSRLIRDARIPLFSSKFSKRTYPQHQLLTHILQKEYLSKDYRDTVELIEIRDTLREKIHKLIHDTLNSLSLLPIRNRKRKRISGYYRRRIAQSFDEER